MRKLVRTLTVILGMTFFTAAIAADATAKHSTLSHGTAFQIPFHGIALQIVQKQMIFDRTNVESASVIKLTKFAPYFKDKYGVHLILNSLGAKQFSEMTNKGKRTIDQATVNGNLAHSLQLMGPAVGYNVTVPFPSKEKAEQCIKNLGLKK